MVRLYDTQAKFLTLLLFYLRDSMGLTPADIVYYFQQREASVAKRSGKTTAALLAQATHDLRNENLTTEDLIASLITQLYEKTLDHDGDLVEVIVGMLGLEFGGNRLTGRGTLEMLRKAVLLPDELRKLKELLQKNELRCSCGHRFNDGELTTASLTRDGVQLVCGRCRLPNYVACMKQAGCASLAQIDERDLSRMARATCAEHRGKKGTEKEEPTTDPAEVQDALNQRLRSFQRFTLGTPTRRVRPVVVPPSAGTIQFDAAGQPLTSPRRDVVPVEEDERDE